MSKDNFDIMDLRKGFSVSIEVKMDEEDRKDLEAMFFLKQLEALVPPSELCMEIPQDDFYGSALAWYMNQNDPSKRVVMPRYADVPGWVLFAPAPTLEEIVEALNDCGNVFLQKDDDGWMIMSELPGDDEGYGYEVTTERAPDNPATAALKLWMKANREN